jgi:putative transposase
MISAGNKEFTKAPTTIEKKYGGMQLQEMQRLKQLEEENRRLKQMYAELSLDYKILKDVIKKKL